MEQQQVQIVEEQEGVTLGRFFKVVFHRWKLLLLITVLVTGVGSVAFIFGYNKFIPTYSSTFSYNTVSVPGDENLTAFAIEDFSTKETLEAVKSSNDSLKNINVDKLIKDKAINITDEYNENTKTITTKAVTYNDSEDKEVTKYVTITPFKVTLTINVKYFDNFDIAATFVKTLANYPVVKYAETLEKANLGNDLSEFDSQSSFDSKIDLLSSQYSYLSNSFGIMKNCYDKIVYDDGKTIDTYYSKFDSYFSQNNIKLIKNLCDSKGYVDLSKKDTYKVTLTDKAETLKSSYKNVNNRIKERTDLLTTTGASGVAANLTQIGNELQELMSQKNDYSEEYISIQKKLATIDSNGTSTEVTIKDITGTDVADKFTTPAQTDIDSFSKQLNNIHKEMESFTGDLKTAKQNSLKTNYNLTFATNDVIKTNKSLNTIVCVLISLLIGLVVAIIVNAIVDRKYFHHPFPSELASTNATVEEVSTTDNVTKEEVTTPIEEVVAEPKEEPKKSKTTKSKSKK